jgi:hypothetical protein
VRPGCNLPHGCYPSPSLVPVAMIETEAERFRKEAEECRELAEKAISQFDKEAWLRLAADWIKLAQATEARRRF